MVLRPVLTASALWFGIGITVSACVGSAPPVTAPRDTMMETTLPEPSAMASQRRAEAPLALYLDAVDGDARPRAGADTAPIIGFDDGPVPPFVVSAEDGAIVDSRALVGREPFVVVFFSNRCPVCSVKLALVNHVLREAGPIRTLWVYAGSAEQATPLGFLDDYGVNAPVIDAHEHPLFAFAYNPFRGVPVVAVVGRGGGLVEYQLGLHANDPMRLARAIEFAQLQPPAETVP